jgi:hypothetical protein
MNTKTANRKTKAPASRSTVKPTPGAVSTKKSTAASAAVRTGKPAAAVRSKVVPRKVATCVASGTPPVPVGQSKQASLISLLQVAPGATIEQMTTLTGWQAHTVRGTISGVLRKKLGLNVTCAPSAESGPRLYRIVGDAVGA